MSKIIYPLTLSGSNGTHVEFWSREEALTVLLAWSPSLQTETFRIPDEDSCFLEFLVFTNRPHYALRNPLGELVTYGDFHELQGYSAVSRSGLSIPLLGRRRSVSGRARVARGMPVPGTGRRGGYCYYRRPSTSSERRLQAAFDEARSEAREHGAVLRGRRRQLVSSWDDISRGDVGDRSWKRFRRHQWKAVA